jgi:hypothetical protein
MGYTSPLHETSAMRMSLLRYSAATISMLLSGWFLLAYHGLAQGSEIYQLPPHPTLLKVAYLGMGMALPFLSAWLIGPGRTNSAGTGAFSRSFSFRLILSAACGFLAALLIAFLAMALMDAGVI